MMYNVSSIASKNLCCSCSACAEVCNKHAISYNFDKGLFLPIIETKSCSNCGRCLQVCPSAEIKSTEFYGGLDLFCISEKECYIAYSTDENIRRCSTSGGIVTTMVKSLLSQGIYRQAFLLEYTHFDGKASLAPFTKEDNILNSAKSKYIPASVNNVIATIRDGNISNSIVVCTPCQLLSIKKALRLYKHSEDDILFIGLFCDKTLNYNIYKYYQHRYGEYSQLNFRDKDAGGWPGDTLVIQNGKSNTISRTVRMSLKPYFELNRCRHCFDKLNQLSDISVGDCYLPNEEDSRGKSNIIIRTEKGKKALLQCDNCLALKSCTLEEIKEAQKLVDKKKNLIRSINEPLSSEMKLGMDLTPNNEAKITQALSSAGPHKKQHFKWFLRIIQFFYNPDRSYYVFINNAGFNNKGDQLMIQAVVDQIRIWKPTAKILLGEKAYNQNRSYCYENHILPLQTRGSRWKVFKTKFCYNNLLNQHIYITPNQVDLILDTRGFIFGDQWEYPNSYLKTQKQFYELFCKKNRKIYFLPQALGPFKKEFSRQIFQQAYQYADKFYARDHTSYCHASAIVDDASKLDICPDFTISTHASTPPSILYTPKSYVVVIANARMVDKTTNAISQQYLRFMVDIIQMLIDKGENVVLLNHEGYDDEKMLYEINQQLSISQPIITNLSGLDIKAIIGRSKLTISSRYHGVVSGLVQNIPTLCTSWSHKYTELLNDHHCPNNILDILDIEKSKRTIREALSNPEEFSSGNGCNNKICILVNNMWRDVFSE